MKNLATIMLLVAIVASSIDTKAQNADNRSLIYLGAGIEKEFMKQLSAGVDLESRFCKASGTQEILVTPSIEYQPIKYLQLGVEYRANYEHKNDKGGSWSGRFGASLGASISPWILKLEVREKYCNYSDDSEDGDGVHLQYLRTKVGASAKIKAIKLTPYISYEFFYNVERKLVDKDRYTVGVKKKISKRNTIGLEYMLEEKFNRGKNKIDINKHIFALNYKYTIPAPKKKDKEKETPKSEKDSQ